MLDIDEIIFLAIEKYNQKLTKKDCFDILLNYDKYRNKYGNKN
jgi:hypothetical protein